jgi:hypothetical protein
VKADDGDLPALQAIGHEQGFNRLGVCVIDQALGLGQRVRARGPIGQIDSRSGGAAQQRAFGFAIGPARGGAELADAFTVGVEDRDIDAVL